MASRPDLTVVIRTPDLLLRADVRAGEEPVVSRWRGLALDPPTAVVHALGEGGRAGRRVWVLDSGVWLGDVGLSGSAVAGLSDKELANPAAFEAEAVSDLRPDEAATAVQRRRIVEQDDQFLVAQVRRSDLVAVAKAVKGAGSRLVGVRHPAGLPARLEGAEAHTDGGASAADAAWRRVEFWSDSVVLAEGRAGRVTLKPLGVGPASDWRRGLAGLLRDSEATEADHTLLASGVEVRGGPEWGERPAASESARWLAAVEDVADDGSTSGETLEELSRDDVADRFAAAWARVLAAEEGPDGGASPTLRPPKAPAARWPAVVAGLVAVAGAGVTVLGQREAEQEAVRELKRRLEIAQGADRSLSALGQEANGAKKELRVQKAALEELEAEIARASRKDEPQELSLPDRRPALAALLSGLTASSSEQLVLESIRERGPRHAIQGRALTSGAASGLAGELDRRLRSTWVVHPARIEAEGERSLWRFTIEVSPLDAEEGSR